MNLALPYLLTLIALLGLSLWERALPLCPYPRDKSWNIRLVICASLGIATTVLIGLIIEPYIDFLREHSPIYKTLTNVPDWADGFISYLLITFIVYWWHRYRHHSNKVWKIFHQIHHSTYRLQAATALYAHPSDFFANMFIINLVSYGILGLDIESASWATFWVSIFEYWEHTNIRTPRWLGFFIVRPEMHRIHHERYRHTNNYGLPIWDMLFGTYENSNRTVECGFEEHNEKRISEMLACKKVE